jgi:hypothetical protein
MMTRYLGPSEFLTGLRTDRTARYRPAVRAALLWERAWPALWPASAIAGLFVAAALFELLSILPWALHALILSGAITASALALYFGFRDLKLPRWSDGARRLEQNSGFAHRPISEAEDTMAAGLGDDLAESLWQLHLLQRLARIGNHRAARTRSWSTRSARFALLCCFGCCRSLRRRRGLSRRLWAGFSDSTGSAAATLDA